MAMRRPPHPGGILRRQSLEPLGPTVTRAAAGLGVTRQALSDLVNGKASVSVEMAIRLSKAFGSTPETWLGMQMAHDLWQARKRAGTMPGRTPFPRSPAAPWDRGTRGSGDTLRSSGRVRGIHYVSFAYLSCLTGRPKVSSPKQL